MEVRTAIERLNIVNKRSMIGTFGRVIIDAQIVEQNTTKMVKYFITPAIVLYMSKMR